MTFDPPAPRPTLVVVTGPPGAGKTSIARPLAVRLGLPLFCKDDLKEILFEALGWGDRATSRSYSDAAYEILFHLTEQELAARRSLMIEANFRPETATRLGAIGRSHPFFAVQIRCFAARPVLEARLTRRAHEPLRHPGHVDSETVSELDAMLASGQALALGGPVLEVDTTGPEPVDCDELAQRVKALIDASDER
ncbi:MAG TPA: AAA family ATPase [Actinomycetota bacterium]|nr:AAA family ATPase [Actinomycetota bacterium]